MPVNPAMLQGMMAAQRLGLLRARTPNKIAGTSFVNEIVDKLNSDSIDAAGGQIPKWIRAYPLRILSVHTQIDEGRYNTRRFGTDTSVGKTGPIVRADLGTEDGGDTGIGWWLPYINGESSTPTENAIAIGVYLGRSEGKEVTLLIATAGGESMGQYQYQVHQMTAQNQSGWTWPRATPDFNA